MSGAQMGEFELIEKYFKTRFASKREDLPLGIGDDCAFISVTPGHQLAVSTDTLVQGTHFFADVDPYALGHKCLAVNLSDLAACGALPKAFTLALTLPSLQEAWLQAFSEGLYALANTHDCALIGGDTTRGPMSIGLTVFGEVPMGQGIKRSGAQVGDDLYVSGTLGDARWALEALQGKVKMDEQTLLSTRVRLERPTPRIELGLALRGLVSAGMDLSDGLLGDLAHLLKASGRGARLDLRQMLMSPLLSASMKSSPANEAIKRLLQGGDDYELLFAAPPKNRTAIEALSSALGLPLTKVGEVVDNEGIELLHANEVLGAQSIQDLASFDHFL
jgi:thiamine-monophosphate kinase